MKSVKFLFLIALVAIVTGSAKAQVPSNIQTSPLFQIEFTKLSVWNIAGLPVMPVTGKALLLTGLNSALDANKALIDWGTNRYLMFNLEVDNAKTTNSLVDDINNGGTKYNVSLKLFEFNGTLVKVVSKWGKIIGIGDAGFIYEMEGKYATFFSNSGLRESKLSYVPTIAFASKMSEIPKVGVGFKTSLINGNWGTGILTFYNETKGVGTIVDQSTGQELLVLRSGIRTELKVGDHVIFNIKLGKKGFEAIDVKGI